MTAFSMTNEDLYNTPIFIVNYMISSNHIHQTVADDGDRDLIAGDIGIINAYELFSGLNLTVRPE